MRTNGIRHCIIEMQGTKKVEISEAVMNSIMEVVLDKENHPLLIHCNHGKVLLHVVNHVLYADYPTSIELVVPLQSYDTLLVGMLIKLWKNTKDTQPPKSGIVMSNI